MNRLTIREIAQAVGGRAIGKTGATVCGVFTDTRQPVSGGLFVPIRGERFDGHDYIAKAFDEGAACALSERAADVSGGYPVIRVADTRKALAALAAWYRRQFPALKVVGVTGSVGKTTTRAMIASVLAKKRRVTQTIGNFNNDIGLPLSIFNITEKTEAAVLEMGMNHAGELRALSRVAAPDIACITNIGTAHMAHFGSREAIFRAKIEIFEHLRPNGLRVVNGDDGLLAALPADDTVFYGLNGSGYTAREVEEHGLDGVSFTCQTPTGAYRLEVPAPGRHMVYAALCAAAVAERLGLAAPDIQAGVAAYAPPVGRGDITRTGRTALIDGAYNASPESVRAAIDTLCNANGRTVCVLGSMLELGAEAPRLHREAGAYAARAGVNLILCVSDDNLYQGAVDAGGQAVYYETREALINALPKVLRDGDTVLVKASHGAGFDKIVSALREEF